MSFSRRSIMLRLLHWRPGTNCFRYFLLTGLIIAALVIFFVYHGIGYQRLNPKFNLENKGGPQLNHTKETLPHQSTNTPFKKILFWNIAYDNKQYGVGFGRGLLRNFNCPVWQCDTSEDRSNIDDYDAIVFHLRHWTTRDLPSHRLPHQRYVFWSRESPSWSIYNLDSTDSMKNFFNWTITYRRDSDMVHSYGYITPTDDVPLHPNGDQLKYYISTMNTAVNYAKGKTRMAAWLVSNCHSKSKRNEMVAELRKYIDVDIYGDCGTLECPKKQPEECRKMISEKYKFYLALENSLCLDYVTEKFFGFMDHNIIPVVLGLHNSHENVAPNQSFINAANFGSIKQLADYLILLDKNDTLYNEYFWWKPHFKVEIEQNNLHQGICSLCAALHSSSEPPKVYQDMTEWWEKNSSCKIPNIV